MKKIIADPVSPSGIWGSLKVLQSGFVLLVHFGGQWIKPAVQIKKTVAAMAVSSVCLFFSLSAQTVDTHTGQTIITPADQSAATVPSEIPADTGEKSGLNPDDSKKKAVVPPAKRPLPPDREKTAAAESRDEGKDVVEKNRQTLKFGIESDITSLIDTLTQNDDPRFADDLYDLFQMTTSSGIREKILGYFTKMGDPCLEDYAVTVLNDPYDLSNSLVSAVFVYTAAVKCKAAVPAVLTLLDSDNAAYFDGALSALGDIGSEDDAVHIADLLDRTDLSVAQRQTLVKVLGKIKAEGTVDKLTKLAKDSDENMFVRAYAAEAIGMIGKPESLPVLEKLFEEKDPTIRMYVIRGLKKYGEKDVGNIIIQGIRDSYYKVRLEAIQAAGELDIKDAVPYLVYRAKNDPEGVVKEACYPVIARQNTKEGNDFLISIITDKSAGDTAKAKTAAALMKYGYAGKAEILDLAKECLANDLRKPLRYALGKQFALYDRPEYADICKLYLGSGDPLTVGTGLDIYAQRRYTAVTDTVQAIAADAKAGVNQKKARRILGLE